MQPSLTLGPFRLVRHLGSGGMGSVWRAVHVRQEHPVAIKVMTADKVSEERFRDSFYEEVRAVARLHHPNIIRVFDCGEIPPSIEDKTDGAILAGSPYLVMELAQSTLAQIDHENLTWPVVRSILLHILDALAYSHARGLIHRDLKPDNILFFPESTEGQLKLSDFGLACVVDAPSGLRAEDQTVSGTPRYMAPEQIRGRLRDQGPWTDLYNLGGMAYWLASGSAPFRGECVDEVLRGHLVEPRPPLEPRVDVPEGFSEWARRLIVRDPSHRFRRAADAAQALVSLEEDTPGVELSFSARLDDGDQTVEMTLVDELDATHILHETLHAADSSALDDGGSQGEFDEAVPELPDTWRHRRRVDTPEMIGVGLGLYGIREVPLVGRHRERDRLWQALADARDTRRPHAVILSGPTGVGKTTLAEWLAERAHEVGAVDVLKARHSPISGPSHGLAGMFAEFLRCIELPGSKLLEHIRDQVGGEAVDEDELHQCLALTSLLAPAVDPNYDPDQLAVRFGSRDERYLVWMRLLERLAEHRPLLLVFDDVQWGANALQFAHFLFEKSEQMRLPVLIVITARDDLLENRSREAELLTELGTRGLVHRMELGRLSRQAHQKLVQNLLGLEKELADEVVRRTEGNPLFASQLVGDWVERGVLEIGTEGFRLVEGADASMPEDVTQLLTRRLEQVVGHGIDEAAGERLVALELAVTLGRQVDRDEWHRLCARAGVDIPERLVDAMVARSLAEIDDRGWAFVHGAMRETLEEISRDNGRWSEHHRLCGRLLCELYDDTRGAVAPRVARHLLVAGEYEEALDPLLDAINFFRITDDVEEGHRFYEMYRNALCRLDIGEDDRRTVAGKLEYANLYQRKTRLREAEQLLEHCHEKCRHHGWDQLLAKTLVRRASNARMASHLDEAERYTRQALSLYRQLEDSVGIARALKMLGWVHKWKSQFEAARDYIERAEQRFRRLDEPDDHAGCMLYLAAIHCGLEDFEQATEYARRGRDAFEELGNFKAVAYCLNSLGECHRFRGELDEAARYYEEAVDIGERLGLDRDMATYFNVGAVHMMRDDFMRAALYLEEALRRAEKEDRPGFLAIGHVGMLACSAGLGRFEVFDEHAEQAQIHLERTSMADRDLPLTCEIAAEQARKAGHRDRARRAYELALDQWEVMGNEKRREAVREKLRTL